MAFMRWLDGSLRILEPSASLLQFQRVTSHDERILVLCRWNRSSGLDRFRPVGRNLRVDPGWRPGDASAGCRVSRYTLLAIGIVLLMALAAFVGEWCGILAFAIALLMVFEIDLRAEPDDDDLTGDSP